MSAISVKSFTGPFRNKVHLISLVLITALFGAYRWSGGGFSVQATGAAQSGAAPVTAAPVRQNPLAADPARAPARPAANTTRPRTTTPKKSLSLDEIESELGLNKRQ